MRLFYICLLVCFQVSCQKSSPFSVPANQVISYLLKSDQYVVIVVKDNGVSNSQAKQEALKKAAQMTLDSGYNYFTVVSMENVYVLKTQAQDQNGVPKNIYQELIIEKQFGREVDGGSTPIETVPAIRLTFQCYLEKPILKNAYDARKMTADES